MNNAYNHHAHNVLKSTDDAIVVISSVNRQSSDFEFTGHLKMCVMSCHPCVNNVRCHVALSSNVPEETLCRPIYRATLYHKKLDHLGDLVSGVVASYGGYWLAK